MFILRKNAITLTRYTQNAYTTFTTFQRIGLSEYQQLSLVKNMPSQPLSNVNIRNVDHSSDSNKVPEENASSIPSDLQAITKGDKELEHKLRVLMLETEVLRQEGKAVPPEKFMTPEIWENLLKLPSRSARTKYLVFLFRASKKKENELARKLEKRKEYEEALSKRDIVKNLPIEEHAMSYGLLHNNIFIRFHDTRINHFYNNRLIQAMQFGQKLVIDCGYDHDMTKRENNNTAKQLMLMFSENRNNDDPFDIHYTNIHKGTDLVNMLHKYVPTMYDEDFPMNIHEESYLDLFPKQKLVYLSPHCRDEMDSFDHDAIYIIGAIVDKVNQEPLSLAKAKREGITMKKFPLDRYLQWGSGSGKSLTINQCVAILLDMKTTGDWTYSLRHVPKRKLMDTSSPATNVKFTGSRKNIFPQKRSTWKPNNAWKSLNIQFIDLKEN